MCSEMRGAKNAKVRICASCAKCAQLKQIALYIFNCALWGALNLIYSLRRDNGSGWAVAK